MDEPIKKKRGRKPKTVSDNNLEADVKPAPKKRGRKPKGGKIIENVNNEDDTNVQQHNIILHLKCSLSDLNVNTIINSLLP